MIREEEGEKIFVRIGNEHINELFIPFLTIFKIYNVINFIKKMYD